MAYCLLVTGYFPDRILPALPPIQRVVCHRTDWRWALWLHRNRVAASDGGVVELLWDQPHRISVEAARDAAQAAAANESDKDKLKRLRAEQKA